MKNISQLEQEKEKLLQELEQLKKQIQQDIIILEKKYTSQNITKNITKEFSKEFSKQYLNKRNLIIIGASIGAIALFYTLLRGRRRKKISLSDKGAKKVEVHRNPIIKQKNTSLMGELAKEVIWTVTLEIIRKKVNEYLKQKNKT